MNNVKRLVIDSELILAHVAEVITLHPQTQGLFRLAFPKYHRPVTPEGICKQGLGMQHALGLIDLSLRCMSGGQMFCWQRPEELLDLVAQNALVDVLAVLIASDKTNLLDL